MSQLEAILRRRPNGGPFSAAAFLAVACCGLGDARAAVVEDFEGGRSLVYIISVREDRPELHEMIDRWAVGYVQRKLEEARAAGANLVVVEIDSLGGVVHSMVRVSNLLISYPIPTCALVRNKAWSAAAAIAIACDEIYMQRGSSIGAAEPILITPGGAKPAGRKSVSVVAAAFRSLAEAKGHSVAVAQAMVDADVEIVWANVGGANKVLYRSEFEERKLRGEAKLIEVICEEGKLLTFTAEEAVKYGLAKGIVGDRRELLDTLGYADATEVDAGVSRSEKASRLLSSPIFAGLLLSVGSLALFAAVYSSSTTAAAIAAFAYGMFFWSQFVAGNASGLEMFLFFLGVILLGVEIFALPGFGLAGVSGVVLVLVSLVLALLPPGMFTTAPEIGEWRGRAALVSLGTVFGGLVGAGLGVVALMRILPRFPVLQRIVLEASARGGVPAEIPRPPVEEAAKGLMGAEGVVLTTLRPGGKAEFGEKVLNVVADGEFIDAGAKVRVIKVGGNRVVVTRA